MLEQTLLLVDESDKFLGYEGRSACHSGKGKRHRAFVTLLFNSKGEVLLQKRKHKLFNGFWDLTAISHPLHINGRDESYQQASDRALFKEMGIKHVDVKQIGAFNYYAKDGKNCENEYCVVLVGDYNGKYKVNPEEIYESKWINFEDLIKDVLENSGEYTPWAGLAINSLSTIKLGSSFNNFLGEFIDNFELYAKDYFAKKIKDSKKYPKLITGLYRDIYDFCEGGKRLRAFLVYLGYLSGKRKISSKFDKKILPVSLAIELFHGFLLIHDDIIDKTGIRHNKLTVHKRYEKIFGYHYGISQAIVVGDIACFEAYDLVNSSSFLGKQKVLCIERLNQVFLETAYGEVLDVEYSFRKAKVSDVMQVADLKTARYSFVGPMTIGALLGSASEAQLNAINKFGLALGVAFQLQDDFLGVFGYEKILGKSVLSDMREGKNTLLIYKARELAKDADRKFIDKVWGRRNASVMDLEKVKNIIKKSGADRWCEAEMQSLVEKAKKYVKLITTDPKLEKIIFEMADFIVKRTK